MADLPNISILPFVLLRQPKIVDEYLYMRKRHGENLKQDSATGNWMPGDTPLIIRQFNKSDFAHKILPLQPTTITTKIIASKLSHLGIRNKIVHKKIH